MILSHFHEAVLFDVSAFGGETADCLVKKGTLDFDFDFEVFAFCRDGASRSFSLDIANSRSLELIIWLENVINVLFFGFLAKKNGKNRHNFKNCTE